LLLLHLHSTPLTVRLRHSLPVLIFWSVGLQGSLLSSVFTIVAVPAVSVWVVDVSVVVPVSVMGVPACVVLVCEVVVVSVPEVIGVVTQSSDA